MKKTEKSAPPPPVVFKVYLRVIARGGENLFYDRVSKRAARELLSFRFPAGTSLQLRRDHKRIASAQVVYRDHEARSGESLMEVFTGDSWRIVLPEIGMMERYERSGPDHFCALYMKADNFLRGDLLVLTICAKDSLTPDATLADLQKAFRSATLPSRRAAARESLLDATYVVTNELLRLVPLAEPTGDLLTWRRNPWFEQLDDAIKRIGGLPKPKEQTPEEILERLRKAASASAKVVIVLKTGERVRGRPSRPRRGNCNLELEPGGRSEPRLDKIRGLLLDEIRRVVRVKKK